MSITSALLGLGIALTATGGIGTFCALINALVMLEGGGRRERKASCILLAVMVGILSAGAFLLGLTIPAVQQ